MLRFYIKQTDEYERLIEFLKPMGLEFSDEGTGIDMDSGTSTVRPMQRS
jgi:hypothetical protein